MLVNVAGGYQVAVFLSDCVRERDVVLRAAAARYLPRAARRDGEKKVRIPRGGPLDPRNLSRGRPDLLHRSLVRERLGALPLDVEELRERAQGRGLCVSTSCVKLTWIRGQQFPRREWMAVQPLPRLETVAAGRALPTSARQPTGAAERGPPLDAPRGEHPWGTEPGHVARPRSSRGPGSAGPQASEEDNAEHGRPMSRGPCSSALTPVTPIVNSDTESHGCGLSRRTCRRPSMACPSVFRRSASQK
jgi:hypothetical protein